MSGLESWRVVMASRAVPGQTVGLKVGGRSVRIAAELTKNSRLREYTIRLAFELTNGRLQ